MNELEAAAMSRIEELAKILDYRIFSLERLADKLEERARNRAK